MDQVIEDKRMDKVSEYRLKTYQLTIDFGAELAQELNNQGKFEEEQIVRDLVDMARQLAKCQGVWK